MNNPLNLQLIIFDMDGLMLDTEKISYEAWRAAATNHGYTIDKALFEKTLGRSMLHTQALFMEAFGEDFPFEKVKADRVILSSDMIETRGVPIKKGLFELLDYIRSSDIKMAVATSTSRQRALGLLRKAGVDTYFDTIFCGDEITHSKPDPEIFLKVAERLNCKPENCLVLEDSESGIQAAYSGGMIPIMIPDLKEPTKEVAALAYKRMGSLLEVIAFIENGV